MPKQRPNGTPGQKPPAPSVKVRRPTAFGDRMSLTRPSYIVRVLLLELR
jgi:hypothetical protein